MFGLNPGTRYTRILEVGTKDKQISTLQEFKCKYEKKKEDS